MRVVLLLLILLVAGACSVEPTPLPPALLIQEPTLTAAPTVQADAIPLIAIDSRLEALLTASGDVQNIRFLENRPASLGTGDDEPDAWIGLDLTADAIDCLLRVETGLSIAEDAPTTNAPDWLTALEPDADATAIRLLLANAGYPDGYRVDVTGIDWVTTLWNVRLSGTGMQLRHVPAGGVGQTWAIFAHQANPAEAGRQYRLPELPIYCAVGQGIGIEPSPDALPRIFRSP